MKINLNRNWSFIEMDGSAEQLDKLKSATYDASEAQQVSLPHTFTEIPFHYANVAMSQKLACYRRVFDRNKAWHDQRVLLTVGGASVSTDVYLNGERLLHNEDAFSPFTVDLTDYLVEQNNVLLICVDSRNGEFGGIYREVYLSVVNRAHIISAHVVGEDLMTETPRLRMYLNATKEAQDLVVRTEILSMTDGKIIMALMKSVHPFSQEMYLDVQGIRLWDLEHPNCYRITIRLYNSFDDVIDTYSVTTGFRVAEFRQDGFYLNNRKLSLRGLTRVQSYPYVGFAMPERPQKTDAEILKKELAVNAVYAECPQSPYFLQRCDELGILVFTPVSDEQSEAGNHPSVVPFSDFSDKSAYMADFNSYSAESLADGICHNGILDMYRNLKPQAYHYAAQQDATPVFHVAASEEMGNAAGKFYVFTNADSVRLYRNGDFVKEFFGVSESNEAFKHPVIAIDDFIGGLLETKEGFTAKQAAAIKEILPYGKSSKAARLMRKYEMPEETFDRLYEEYIRGGYNCHTVYRFEAVRGGKVCESVTREAVQAVKLELVTDTTELIDGEHYDVASVRIRALDQNGQLLSLYSEAVQLSTIGDLEIVGPSVIVLRGGLGGTYVRSCGVSIGYGELRAQIPGDTQSIEFVVFEETFI